MSERLARFIDDRKKFYKFLENPSPIVPVPPENIYIGPTNHCNLKCMPCARVNMRRDRGFMTFENFKLLIDKLVRGKWDSVPITLTGHGEPLLHTGIFDMIKYARSQSITVSMISNASLLTEENIPKLINSGLNRFQTLFDTMDRESFEKFRVGSKYDTIRNNIIALIEANERAGHPIWIGIGSIITSMTSNQEETKNYWNKFPIDNFYDSPLLSLVGDSPMSDEAMSKCDLTKRGICLDPFWNINVTWNGNTELCAIDFNYNWSIGNIFESELEEIWNGEQAQLLRKMLLERTSLSRMEMIFGLKCSKCNAQYIEELTIEGCLKHRENRMNIKSSWFK